MKSLALPVVAIFTIVLVLLIIWMLMKRILKKNTVVSVDEYSLSWKETRCPNCESRMEEGYAFPGKGIFWTHKRAKKPGAFSHVGLALENTFSVSFRPNLNMAWHCDTCKMILIDHSKMLKIRDKSV